MAQPASQFAKVTRNDWLALVKVAPETLISRLEDEIQLEPVYAKAEGRSFARAAPGWRVMARIDDPDPVRANAQALEDLEGGADGLELIFAEANGAYGFGLANHDKATIAQIFERVRFDANLRIALSLGPDAFEQAAAFARHVQTEEALVGRLQIHFGLDPVGALARSGYVIEDWREGGRRLARNVSALRGRGFFGPFVCADGRVAHDAGATPAQELAYVLSSSVAYLRALESQGLVEAFNAIEFRLSADADQLVGLAKFRALRLLWRRISDACGVSPTPAQIHGASSWRMMSRRDLHSNILRSALAGFSAGLGGADSVSLLPFTQPLGLPDAFARRLARNTQLIMLEEAHLGFVEDPAAGAGAFEALTQALCERAWRRFQELEALGGICEALSSGALQRDIFDAAALRAVGGDKSTSDEFQAPQAKARANSPGQHVDQTTPSGLALTPQRLHEPSDHVS